MWKKVKENGAKHYKTRGTEPIDLMRSGGMLRDFALGSIIKYAFRNRTEVCGKINREDLRKIMHYCEILLACEEDE